MHVHLSPLPYGSLDLYHHVRDLLLDLDRATRAALKRIEEHCCNHQRFEGEGGEVEGR